MVKSQREESTERDITGTNTYDFKKTLKKVWHFIWEDDSLLSWIVNAVLAYVIIKFLFYPGIGLLLGTHFPIVAVVSGSMDHSPSALHYGKYSMCGNYFTEKPRVSSFDDWWNICGKWYEQRGITKDEFYNYPLHNGFKRGDLIILTGPDDLERGDVIVYMSSIKPDPIIHRLIYDKGSYYQTKGDNNPDIEFFEKNITKDKVVGKGAVRIPFLGYVKIIFFEGINYMMRLANIA